jgi:hypothetical protein
VDAVHERLTCEEEITVALRPVGAVGAVVSDGVVMVMVIYFDAVPPAPVHVKVYVCALVSAGVGDDPDVGAGLV